MPVYIPIQNTPIQLQDTVTSDNMSGGTLEFYDAGTPNTQTVYSDSSGTSAGNTVTLNSGGMPEAGGNVLTLFRDQAKALKIVGKNAAGAEIFTSDNIPAVASFDSTASAKLDTIEENADVTDATNVGAVVNGLQEHVVPLSDFYLPSTSPCGAVATVEGTAGMPNYRGYPFDGTSVENIEFIWYPPKRWNLGTITAKFYWTSAAIDADGVTWGIKAVALSDGDSFAQSYGTPQTVSDSLQTGAGKLLLTGATSALTITGSPADGDAIAFRIYRDPTDASDTATEDAVLLGAKLFWTSDTLNDA